MKKLLGYQLVTKDGEYPACHYSFEVYPLTDLLLLRLQMKKPMDWLLMPIHEGDIEEPTVVGGSPLAMLYRAKNVWKE